MDHRKKLRKGRIEIEKEKKVPKDLLSKFTTISNSIIEMFAFDSMTDAELIDVANNYIKRHNIQSSREFYLRHSETEIYQALKDRGLLAWITVPTGVMIQRNWGSMSNDKLIDYAKDFINKHGIKNRKALYQANRGLYQVLKKRQLLNRTLSPNTAVQKNWRDMSDEELVERAKDLINGNEGNPRESEPKPLPDNGEPVKYIELDTSKSVDKEYGPHIVVFFDGEKIKKNIRSESGRWSSEQPTTEEQKQFIQDVQNAAKDNPKVRDFIKFTPLPYV